MKEEVKDWWDKAVDDLEKAHILAKNKKYDGAIFYSQQAVEKALKALLIKEKNKLKKIHDLVELGKEANVPEIFLKYCKVLTMAYIYSRYPGVPKEESLDQIAIDFMRYAQEILTWIEKKL
ncbi:HEPN domain-containing protein [Candidatus Woesearchaeota archaeon]|nr:HEPN domain-containing protein [Candidatus Woesearchaeota archaeon]